MHPKLLEKELNQFLRVAEIADHCPNGLHVEGNRAINKVATAVSADIKTLEKAVALGVDALLVHHGLFWFKDPYPLVGTKKKKIELLCQSGISLFAYHVPLDKHEEVGNNWRAAKELGWSNLKPFGHYNGSFIGVKGEFAPLSVPHFISHLETYYGKSAVVALGGKDVISTGALISGGAYKAVTEAACEGLDCFITGNFDEPAWSHAMEEQIHFFALGHTATEKVGPKALADYLANVYGFEAQFLDTDNPF